MNKFIIRNKNFLIFLFLIVLLIPSFVTIFSIHFSKIQSNDIEIIKNTDCSVTYKSINNIKNIEVKYFDAYVFPEVENLLCLGKIKNVEIKQDKTIITVYKNPKIFLYLSLLNLFGLIILFLLNDKYFYFDFIYFLFNGILIFSFIFYQNNDLSILFIYLVIFYPYLQIKKYFSPNLFLKIKKKSFQSNSYFYFLKSNNQYIFNNIYLLAIFLILFERYLYTNLANWQLDQAVNMWVGYKYSLFNMPVGSISSIYIPNPNGAMIIGKLLSFLPTLRSVSIFLSIFQALIILNIQLSLPKKNRKEVSLLILCLLSSLYLLNASIEFWNQYLLLNINLIFISWVIRLIRSKNPNTLPLLTILVLSGPAIYLAGLVNAICIFIVGLYSIYKFSDLSKLNRNKQVIYILLILLIFVFFVWVPYFSIVGVEDIINAENRNQDSNFISLTKAITGFPQNFLFQWSEKGSSMGSLITFAEPNEILSTQSRNLQESLRAFHGLVALFFISHLFTIFINRKKINKENSFYRKLLTTLFLYLLLYYLISPAIGSYSPGEMDLNKNGNPSLAVQFYPISILIMFLSVYTYKENNIFKKLFIPINTYFLGVFFVINILFTHSIYIDNMTYDGPRIPNSDIPWNQKLEALDFIVDDWEKNTESKIIPVYYDFDKLTYKSWITGFGHRMDRYYDAPFTHGRALDYELSKNYGLTNSQEEVQFRSIYRSKYIISYYSLDEPDLKGRNENHYKIGRLRVTIVSDEE